MSKAYNNRGVAYALKGDIGAGIQDYTTAIKVNPQDANGYLNRTMIWLPLRAWEKAKKAELMTAKNNGVDIAAAFHRNHGSVEELEQSLGTQLPADIVALLTPQ